MPEVTADGCPVEVYTLLPAAGEPEIISAVLPAGASVLDLGCATGRIAHPLAEMGYRVFGVDDSAEMLAHLRGIPHWRGRIEDFRADQRFDGVLLASHLVNVPSPLARAELLETAAYHLADDGRLLVEWHPPAWFETVRDGAGGLLGEVEVRIENVSRDRDLLSATVRYSLGDKSWTQPFTTRRLGERYLHGALSWVGLAFDGWCTPDQTWFAARRSYRRGGPAG